MMIPVSGIPPHLYPEVVEERDDLLTREEFIDCVKCGGFINDDGYGHLSDGNFHSYYASIYPSQVARFDWPAWATHIIWFNR